MKQMLLKLLRILFPLRKSLPDMTRAQRFWHIYAMRGKHD